RAGEALGKVGEAAAATLDVLEGVWKKFPPAEVTRGAAAGEAAPPGPAEPAPLRDWLRQAEVLVATQAVIYVSQFFVHLRTLLLSVTVGTLLLLLAATSYPFQPQSLLLVYLLLLVGVVTVGTLVVFVQINR